MLLILNQQKKEKNPREYVKERKTERKWISSLIFSHLEVASRKTWKFFLRLSFDNFFFFFFAAARCWDSNKLLCHFQYSTLMEVKIGILRNDCGFFFFWEGMKMWKLSVSLRVGATQMRKNSLNVMEWKELNVS